MGLSTHILDTALGKPASDIIVILFRSLGSSWELIGQSKTDEDGRCKDLLGTRTLDCADYKLSFATGTYFSRKNLTGLYPYIEIVFNVTDPDQHYHIPLLLTANGYTTYRGS